MDSAANRKLAAAAEIAVVAGLLVAHHALLAKLHLATELLEYAGGAPEHLNPGERLLLALHLALGMPAAMLLGDAFGRLFDTAALFRAAAERARVVAVGGAAFAAVAAALVAAFAFRYAEFTDDERTYLFEARALLDGSITSIAPEPREVFRSHFLVSVGADRWAGIFPPGQPALLALGLLVGHAPLTQYLCAAAAVWVTARAVEEEYGAPSSVVAAVLLATSPALIFVAGTLHNIIPVILCVALVLRHTAKLARGEPAAHGAIVGAVSGLAFLVRPLDGVLLAVWAALALVLTRRFRALLFAAAAGLPFLAIQLLTYRAISGHLLVSPYRVWFDREWPMARLFGFGPTAWGHVHTPRMAFEKTFAALARVSLWAFGWPLSIAAFFALFFGYARDRATRALVVLLGMHLVAYFFYAFGSVHELGSYYHLFGLPALAAITARVVVEARERSTFWRRPIEVAAAASICGALTFVPFQLGRLRPQAARIREPFALAKGLPKPAVIFYDRATPYATSWVYWLPMPMLRDHVWWCRTVGARQRRSVADRHPERDAFELERVNGRLELRPLSKQ